MLDTTAKDKSETKLCNEIIAEFSTIARTGRALGIHLVGAMQKVDANILPGQVKSNMQRVTGALKDSYAIKQFLGVEYRVENFLPGRFLYRPENEIVSFQAYYFDSNELNKIKDYEPDGIVLVEQDEKPKLELIKNDDPVVEDVENDDKSNKFQGFK